MCFTIGPVSPQDRTLLRGGRSSDSRRSADAFPLPAGNSGSRRACGIEVHTAAGTVRDSHPVPSYPSVRRTKGNLRKDKGPQNPEQFKAPGTEVFNIL